VAHRDKVLKPDYNRANPLSYPRITLAAEGGHARVAVHLLVAFTFIGPKPPWLEVNHKNGDKGDPSLDNLEYVTRSQNHKHSYDTLHRLRNTGTFHGMAKLSEQDAKDILAARPEPYGRFGGNRRRGQVTIQSVADRFGVSTSTIYYIWQRRTWRHLDHPTEHG